MLQRTRRELGCLFRRLTAPGFVSFGARCRAELGVKFRREYGRINLGQGVTVIRDSTILAPVSIGDDTYINRGAYLRPETTIGERVNIGAYVRLVTETHEMSNRGRRAGRLSYNPIIIEDGVWIGVGATILGGVTLGRGCVVSAGSVVAQNVPPDTLVAGYPARHVRTLEPLED